MGDSLMLVVPKDEVEAEVERKRIEEARKTAQTDVNNVITRLRVNGLVTAVDSMPDSEWRALFYVDKKLFTILATLRKYSLTLEETIKEVYDGNFQLT